MPASESTVLSLEQHLTELQTFLVSHEASLIALKERFPSSNAPTGSFLSAGLPNGTENANVDAQLRAIHRFIDSHLRNLQALRNLPTENPGEFVTLLQSRAALIT